MKSTGILRKVIDVRILLVANGFRAVLERSSCSPFAAESCAMHYMTDCSGCIAVYIVVSAMNSTQVSRQQHWHPWASRAFARSVSAHVA